ncbi:hypothetical protein ABW21_db0204702 [Orbilia brochopaga]|nr:hypothetical protein ABW21_db0204702 [Drechslerella brochopaga]
MAPASSQASASQANVPPQGTLLAQAIRRNLGSDAGPATQIGASNKTVLEQVLAIYRPDHAPAAGAGAASSSDACPTDNEDVNLNVVQSVVLFGLYNDDPFLPAESYVSQSKDCLAIIRSATQATPRTLTRAVNPDDSLSHGDANLERNENPVNQIYEWSWLLPRLLPLLCRTKLLSIRRDILDTVQVLVSELAKLPVEGDHARTVLAYLKSCVYGVVEAFKSDVKATLRKSFTIPLPAPAFYRHQLHHASHTHTSPPNTTGGSFTVGDPTEACSIAIHITLIVANLASDRDLAPIGKPYLDLSITLLAQLAQICRYLKAWAAVPAKRRLSVQLHKQILEALVEIISNSDVTSNPQLCQLTQKLSIGTIQALLLNPISEIDQETEISLSALILLLLRIAEESSDAWITLSRDLVPCIKRTIQDSAKWQARHRDLRVHPPLRYAA